MCICIMLKYENEPNIMITFEKEKTNSGAQGPGKTKDIYMAILFSPNDRSKQKTSLNNQARGSGP